MRKKFIFGVLFLVLALSAQSQSYFISYSDSLQWPAFAKIATTHDSWILIWFHDDSHPESIELNNSTYFDDFEKVFDQRGLPLLADLEQKSIATWSQHFGVSDAPVILFYRGGRVYHKIEGVPQHTFAEDYKKAQYNYSKYPVWQGEFSKDSIPTNHLMQLVYLEYYNQNYSALRRLLPKMQLQLKDEDLKNPEYWPYFMDFGLDMQSALFLTIRDHEELMENPTDTFPRLDFAERALNFNIMTRRVTMDSTTVKWLSEEIIYPLVSDSSESQGMELSLWQEMLISKKRWKTYRRVTSKYIEQYPSEETVAREVDKALSLNYTVFKEACYEWLRIGLRAEKASSLYVRQAYLEMNEGDYTSASVSAQKAYQYANTEDEKRQVDQLLSALFGTNN
ncbi:MAG: hypothetical protein SchgKO_16890 [Schleiferiaceae bacterium]